MAKVCIDGGDIVGALRRARDIVKYAVSDELKLGAADLIRKYG